MLTMVTDAAVLLATAHKAYPGAHITLTGHSLGGAVAQLVGEASGYDTMVFNAPGGQQLYSNLQTQLISALRVAGTDPNNLGENNNYHLIGDAVSMVPTPIGKMFTVAPAPNLYPDTLWNAPVNHIMTTVTSALVQSGTQIESGLDEPNSGLNFVPGIVGAAVTPLGLPIVLFSFVANTVMNWFDPSQGSTFLFMVNGSSPPITSVTFMDDPNVAYFEVWALNGSSLSSPEVVSAGTPATFASAVTGFEFEGFSSSGQVVALPDGYIFDATFSSAAQVNASLLNLSGTVIFPGQGGSGSSNIQSGSTLIVSSGSPVSGAAVNGGSELVFAGGTSISSTVDDGGIESVWFGGTVSGTSVESGGDEYVGSDGAASGTTVVTGGGEFVNLGGTAFGTTLSGGNQTVFGTASGTTVLSGGTLVVSSGGTATSATVDDGGTEDVYSGGIASDTVLNDPGLQFVSSGGVSTSATLSGGEQDVYGSASSTVVDSGGLEVVESGGTASGTTVSGGGTVEVLDGGTLAGNVVNNGALKYD